LIIEDYATYPDRVPLPEGAPPIADVAIVPLIYRDQIIGTLSAAHTAAPARKEAARVTREDVALLQHLAAQAAVAIENARLLDDLRARLAQLDALASSALDVTSTLDYRQVLDRIATRAQALSGADSAGVTILYSSGELEVVADTGTGLMGHLIEIGKGLLGAAVQTGAPVIVNDYQNWENRLDLPNVHQVRAGMAVPLQVRQRVIGSLDVLTFEGGSDRVFSEADVQTLEQLAAHAAIAIENARLFAENLRELKTRSTWFQEARRRMLASIQATLDLLALQKQHANDLTVEQVVETTRAHLENLSAQPEFSGEEGSFVPVQELARTVAREIMAQHQRPEQNIDLIVDGDPVYLDLHQGNILWLIVRELVAGALEHGLRDAPRGIIHITTRSGRERAGLSVEDDGPDGKEGRNVTLVERLVAQDLKGEFRLQPRRGQQGMQATVSWPVNG
jgi:GAF domain-containing protein